MEELRLLLVDDEPEFVEPTAVRLGRRGVACMTAGSGEEALEILAERSFDCAVVDVKMSRMDGLQLLQKLKVSHPRMPVILLTGHASVELGMQGMELGAFEYLLKPLELEELLDVVRRASAAAH